MIVSLDNIKLAIIGLGYVGLPLAVEFAGKRPVVAFDINRKRINELRDGRDLTLEVSDAELRAIEALTLTDKLEDLKPCNIYRYCSYAH